MVSWRFVAALCLVLGAVCAAPGIAGEKVDKAVDSTDWGKVWGAVYDAATGQPIERAVVMAQHEGQFGAHKRATGKTDAFGEFECSALLGRVSSNVDVGRLLNVSLIGLLAGGATKKTKRIDVSQLALRVTADGYEPFEGIVPVWDADAATFSVRMEPILLARAGSGEVSTVAPGWGLVRVLSVSAEPALARPGQQIEVTVRVKAPDLKKRRKALGVTCWLSFPGHFKSKAVTKGDQDADGVVTFTAKLDGPKLPKDQQFLRGNAGAFCSQYPGHLDRRPGAGSIALVQVARDESLSSYAWAFVDAWRLWMDRKTAEAAAAFDAVAQMPQAGPDDWGWVARAHMRLHQYPQAAAAYGRAMQAAKDDARWPYAARWAQALLRASQPDQVLQGPWAAAQQVKEEDRPKKVPAGLLAAAGRAHLAKGDVAAAEGIATLLEKWSAWSDEEVILFRSELAGARAAAAVRANPSDSKAQADLGRVLCDQGRWEEAVECFRKALAADAAQPAVRTDLIYALTHLTGDNAELSQGLDEAIQNAAQATGGLESKDKSKDFYGWHKYGLLLFRKASLLQGGGDSPESGPMADARKALGEAVKLGRAGETESVGTYSWQLGYLSSATRAIEGFRYREAEADNRLLQGLGALANNPYDPVALYVVSTALADLDQHDLATRWVRRLREVRPESVDGQYAEAVVLRRTGKPEEAAALLKRVIKANPRHPKAGRLLAEIYTEEGRVEEAAACLAAYAQFYGAVQDD